MSEVKTKITNSPNSCLCKVKIYSPRSVRRYLSPGNSIILEIAATLIYYSSASQVFTDFGAHFVETQARFQQACEPFLLTEQY